MKLKPVRLPSGSSVELWSGDERVVGVAAPVVVEFAAGATGRPTYDELDEDDGVLVGTATVRHGDDAVVVRDEWSTGDNGVTVARSVSGPGTVRVSLEGIVLPESARFDDVTLFAPPALYDLNDIDDDGVEDYTDTRSLTFRDDRLTGLAVLAYSPRE